MSDCFKTIYANTRHIIDWLAVKNYLQKCQADSEVKLQLIIFKTQQEQEPGPNVSLFCIWWLEAVSKFEKQKINENKRSFFLWEISKATT